MHRSEGTGIDQARWLEFLDGLEKAIKLNFPPCIVNVALCVTGNVHPTVEGIFLIMRFVTLVVHLSIEGAGVAT